MKTKNTIELKPGRYDSVKSFYGKARIRKDDKGGYILTSYNTDVCRINRNGSVIRLWDGYSATTMRHVNTFINIYAKDKSQGGKKWWNSQKVKEV